MRAKNPYYGQCVYLIRGVCEKHGVDVYTIKRADDLPICCVASSPYTKQNCKFFKDKNTQTHLGDFQ